MPRAKIILPLITIMVSSTPLTGNTSTTHLVSALGYGAVRECLHINYQRLGVSIPIQYTRLCKLADGGGQYLRHPTKACRPGRLTMGEQ